MNLIVKLVVAALRLLYVPYKMILKPRNKIAMLSRQSNEAPISFLYTKEALKKQDPDVEVVILAKKIEGSLWHKIGYCFHIPVQMYHIATSKIVLVDGFCIPVSVLSHKKEQKFVQLWHALNIIKKFAYLALDKPDGVNSEFARIMCMHRNYTHLLCGCRESGELLQRSFHAQEAEPVLLGLPYIDYLLNKDQDVINRIYDTYPQMRKGKKTILYAPTFRRNHPVDISWIEEKINLDEYQVIVKLHPVDRQGFQGNFDERIICDEKFRTHEWLWLCEQVITDYSGISVEAALLDRRLYFYLYDRERYEEEVGLNIDLYEEPLAPYVCESADRLTELLEEEYDYRLLKAYRDKYIQFDTNDCSGQFAAWLLKEL